MPTEPGITTDYRFRTRLILFALAGLSFFVAIVLAQHFLTPSLSPLRHQVSEYANSAAGPLMTIGFLLWALSLLATGLLVRLMRMQRLLPPLLILAATGMLLTAIFPTETTAGELQPGTSLTTTGRLHDLGSGLTGLTLLTAAIAVASNPGWRMSFRRWSTTLAVVATAISGTLLLVGPEVGGLRQRLVLLAGCCWQLLLLRELRRRGDGVRAGTVR